VQRRETRSLRRSYGSRVRNSQAPVQAARPRKREALSFGKYDKRRKSASAKSAQERGGVESATDFKAKSVAKSCGPKICEQACPDYD
jgi:hypothetical protein